MPDQATAIRARNVTKTFGRETAVRDISFELPEGKILGVIGPSGCGKTTTVRLLLGIYQPTSGEVRVMGKPPHSFHTREKRNLGYMPQLFVLYPQLTVWENLNFAASLYGMSLLHRRQRLLDVLTFVELDEHHGKLARNVSGGMQRRLSLAATLVHEPRYLFLDEPTAGIDPVLRRKFWDHFRALRDEGVTLVVTTQYVGEAVYCDLVAVMARGRILVIDTPGNLRKLAFGGEIVQLVTGTPLPAQTLAGIQARADVRKPVKALSPTEYRIVVEEASVFIPQLIDVCTSNGVEVTAADEYVPAFDDVFVELVKRDDGAEAQA